MGKVVCHQSHLPHVTRWLRWLPCIRLPPSSESGVGNTAHQWNHFSPLANPRACPPPDHHWIYLPEIQWFIFVCPASAWFSPSIDLCRPFRIQWPVIILRVTFLIAPVMLSPPLICAIQQSALSLRSLRPPTMKSTLPWLFCAPGGQQRSTTSTLCNYSTTTAISKEEWPRRKGQPWAVKCIYQLGNVFHIALHLLKKDSRVLKNVKFIHWSKKS